MIEFLYVEWLKYICLRKNSTVYRNKNLCPSNFLIDEFDVKIFKVVISIKLLLQLIVNVSK